jgi:hypothetical protein
MSDEQTTLVYKSVVEFVESYLSSIYRSDIAVCAWCPEWWKHAEAVARFDALWRTWEHYRIDGPTGLSVWLIDHAGPHMNVLLSPAGSFSGCSVRKGHSDKIPSLPLKSPSPHLFLPPTHSMDE